MVILRRKEKAGRNNYKIMFPFTIVFLNVSTFAVTYSINHQYPPPHYYYYFSVIFIFVVVVVVVVVVTYCLGFFSTL